MQSAYATNAITDQKLLAEIAKRYLGVKRYPAVWSLHETPH